MRQPPYPKGRIPVQVALRSGEDPVTKKACPPSAMGEATVGLQEGQLSHEVLPQGGDTT